MSRGVRRFVALTAALPLAAGCVDAPADTPYVLTSGLGKATSICIEADGRLLVGSSTGGWAVASNGAMEQVFEGPVHAVAAQPDWRYALGDDSVAFQASVGPERGRVPASGAIDLVAVANKGEVWLLFPDRIESLNVGTRARGPLQSGLVDARALAWGFDGRLFLLTATGVSTLDEHGVPTPLPGALKGAVAVAGNAEGDVYVVDEVGLRRLADPPVTLSVRVDGVTDLVPSIGPLLPAGTLYGVNEDGRIDFWRPRDLEPQGPAGRP